MSQAVTRIVEEVKQLSAAERTDFFARISDDFAGEIAPEISEEQISELRRRVAQVEAGEVTLISGEDAMAHIRQIVASALAKSDGQ
jgi:putative addiction module component (TIGR02574 family)